MIKQSIFLILALLIIVQSSQIAEVQDLKTQEKQLQAYSSELAHTLCGFTVASYCKQKKIENWSCGKICRQNPLSDIEVVYAEETNALAYTGYSSNLNSIVIVFRGTMPLSLENWLSDMDMILINYPYCEGCKIHKGFNDLYQSLQEQLWNNLGALISQYPQAKISLTGHSLGAALSTLCAGDLLQHGINGFTWYNFGSPRVGNPDFQQYLEKSYSERLYRVTHDKDPFVHMPEIDLGYHHLAQEIFYVDSPEPDAEHTFCNMSGEDPNCADQYNKLKEWVINDHNTYMGYNFLKTMTTCNI